jgi:hypothetical protein
VTATSGATNTDPSRRSHAQNPRHRPGAGALLDERHKLTKRAMNTAQFVNAIPVSRTSVIALQSSFAGDEQAA